MKPKIAIVRGAFLNKYEMQFYEPLTADFDITAFASRKPFHTNYKFPVVYLPSPMDIPEFPMKMPILNRLFIDAHYLYGLENKLAGFDLVHSAETYYRYTQQVLDVKKAHKVKKVIATVLENIPFNNEGIWGRKAYKKRARTELDHMIALTSKTKKALLQEGADEKKISIINHYVDTKLFCPTSESISRISNPKQNIFTILFSGRLEEYKGVFDLIEVIRMYEKNKSEKFKIQWQFCGMGSQYGKMLEIEKKYGIESLITHTQASYDEMPRIYQQSDIFIAPSTPTISWEEQYNTALLEAQSTGLPIITTNTGGIPENIGDAGILVEPGDIHSILQALQQLLTNTDFRYKLAQKARDRALKHHDIHIGSGKLNALYRKLLDE